VTSQQWNERQRARSLVETGRFAEARDVLVPLVAAAPDDAEALRLLARAHLGLDDSIRGLQAAHASLLVEPNDPQGHVIASGAYAELGRTQEAIDAAHRSVDADPDVWWTWTTYARALNRDPEQRTDAWLAAIAAVRRAPAEAGVHRAVGDVATALGWTDKAREAYEAALLYDPHDAGALDSLARLQVFERGDPTSETGFMSALSADPDESDAAEGSLITADALVRRALSVALLSAFVVGWSFYAEVPLDLGAWPSPLRFILGIVLAATIVGLSYSVWRVAPPEVREAWVEQVRANQQLRLRCLAAGLASLCVVFACLVPVLPALLLLGLGSLVAGVALLRGLTAGPG